jgi:uncharacterized lipoprotein YajG
MRLATGVIAPLLATVLAAACGRQGSAPPVKAHASLADSAEQVMQNVRSLLTKDGVQRGELFADSAYVFDDNTRFELRAVRATFNTETGVKDGTMRADRGRYRVRELVLEGFCNVVIKTKEGCLLNSPHLKYNQSINEV